MSPTELSDRAWGWQQLIRQGARIVEGPGRRLLPLTDTSLISAARRRTKLSNLGDPAYREPLRRLTESLEQDARLTLLGRLAAREDLTRMVSNRLLIERDRARHPEIAAQEIRRPLFITGLPRSGSTLLHGLLAQDPANRVPRNWEVMYPSPPPDRATHETDRRIDVAERQIRWFYRLAPRFKKIHPVGARLPEECVVILSHSFLSFQFSSSYYVPSYQNWLEAQDLTPAYRYHRQFLQQLQWRCPGERWVLKAPPHLPGLRALCAVYPDAGLIVTHRDPLEVVASVTSLHVVLRETFSDAVDPLAVGPEVSAMLANDIRVGQRERDAGCAPPERYLDLWYEDLLGDPLGAVRRIYAHFDMELTSATESRMHRFLAENPQNLHGQHEYALQDFGLNVETERERYREYRERFGF